ncbi:MAG: hypothetical protein JNN15_13840, partial [Blastocatellia bacterium]|nr:hypothetical protein [Blastocatellia bacterium]
MKRLFLFSTFILSLFLLLIVGSSTALLGSDLEELAEVEHVLSREDYFYQMRSYPFKDIPEGARLRALKQLERGMKLHKLEALQSREWQPIGPAVVPNGQPFDLQRSARIPVSGRATSVLVDPKNPSRIFLGTAQGGVWRSIDAGVSWTPITDNLPSLAIGALAMDPQNPVIIYVGTGEAHFSGNSYYGAGVFKSTDGGESWNATGDLPLRARISSIVIDPINTRNVYAVTALSASGQPADAGIFKSTNGGASWQKSLDGSATDLSIDPVSPSTLVAAIGFPVGSNLNGLYKSVDGGANWRLIRTIPNGTSTGRIELARAASSPNMMFASISNPNPFTLMNLYRSNDGGENWTIVAGAPDYCGAQCFYNNVLKVDPQNPSVVYLGGVPLFRSTDGGMSFREVSTPQQFGFGLHADVHDIAFSPNDTSTIFVACDGGIFRSQDRGNSWLPLNNGISTLQFQSVALDSTDPRRAIGGTQDNGTLLYTGSPVWSLIDFGDGGDTAIDFQSPLIFYHYYFRLFFARSDDGGNSFSLKIDGLPISSSGATTERTLFYAPLTMDSINPSLLYTGAQKLYKTINRAETWSAVSGDLTNGTGAVSAIAVSPSDPRTIFVGSSDAKVSKTDDGGISWQTVTMGLPNRAVTRVAIDPTNSQLVYVTFSGFGTGHVFKSLNGGLTWTDVSDNLPDVPVNAAVIDPNRPNNLYIGTDIGVFQS